MRYQFTLAVACLAAAGALVAGPALAASGSTTPRPVHHAPLPHVAGPRVSVVAGREGATIQMAAEPGTHAISGIIRVTPRSSVAAGNVPDWQTVSAVSVRVGKNNCAGFKGNVEWGGTSTAQSDYMYVDGDLWNNCNAYTQSTVYLYFGWKTAGGTEYDNMIGSVYAGTAGIDKEYPNGTYTNVDGARPYSIDTCLQWNAGWGCGPAQFI